MNFLRPSSNMKELHTCSIQIVGGLKRECGVRGDSRREGGDGQREVEGGGIQYNPGNWNTEENKKNTV